jgi:hypothetical protein
MSILAASLPQRAESGLVAEAKSRARVKSFMRSQHPADGLFAAGLHPNDESERAGIARLIVASEPECAD